MHQALLLVATAIARAHDRWRLGRARRSTLSGSIAVLEERLARLEAENALLGARFLRVPGRRRPHYRRSERMDILWHAARYGLSVEKTADVFVLTPQTILNWRRVARRREPHLLPPLRARPDLVRELVHRLKVEWPRWGTRRIAGQLARLGVKASRSSVQRILRRGPRRSPEPEETVTGSRGRVLLAKRPDHIWMIDFTRVGGIVRPLWVGAVIDAYSRKVLAVAAVRGGPSGSFAVRLLRTAVRRHGAPRWLVSDKDPVLRSERVQRFLTAHGVLRRYGAVGRKGSIALIERTWRSMKEEYVRHLFLHRPIRTLETRLRCWQRWHNAHRPHQGLGQRTPDDVYVRRPPRRARQVTAGTLSVRFLDGDPRLPILRLRDAA